MFRKQLRLVASLTPSRPFVSTVSRSYTYGEAFYEVQRVRQALLAHGGDVNTRILILAANTVDSLWLILAVIDLNWCLALAHSETASQNLKIIMEDSGADIILCDGKARDEVPKHCASSQMCGTIVLAQRRPGKNEVKLEEGLGLIVFTSGTSGKPRGVMLTHHSVDFAVQKIQSRLNYRSNDLVGIFVPLSFDYGLYQIFLALNVGAELYLAGDLESIVTINQAVRNNRITILPAVPTLLLRLAYILERRSEDFASLRVITCTGDRLPVGVQDRICARVQNCELFVMYGLTECKRVSILLPSERSERLGSVGRPLDGTRVTIHDELGCELPPNSVGEVYVHGPHIGMGYVNNPNDSALRFVREGELLALRTGDYGYIDSEGYLYIEGRKDNLVKVNGARVSLLEIEDVFYMIDGVVGVFLKNSQEDGLEAYVKIDPAKLSEELLWRRLIEELEPFKLPRRLAVVEELEVTLNGKVKRR